MLRLACLISLLIAPAVRGELLWPLDQAPEDRALSSSFCEDRGSHLHGGVDMSTGGEVGVPVLAVADGAIVRIKVKYRGLGRAVYLQHPGGLMTVYGHLAGFAEPVRSKIDALIARKGLYPGDWFPDEPVPVKAGQVIAWSGKTGGGPPHLHFETRRNGGNRPVDPWAEGLPCIDQTPPVIDALSIHARHAVDLRSFVEGGSGWNERSVRLPRTDPILLEGNELLRLHVSDPLGAGTGFVRHLTASIGDWELYRWDADSYTYGITRYAGHAFSRAAPAGADPTAKGSWVWLHQWPGGGLPFVKGRSVMDSWELGEPDETHVLTFRARDGCGNETVSRVPIRVVAAAAVAPGASTGMLDLVVAFSRSGSGDGVDERGRPYGLGGGHFPTPATAAFVPGRDLELEDPAARLHVPAEACGTPTPIVLAPIGREPLQVFPRPKRPNAPPEGLIAHGPPVYVGPAALPLSAKATIWFPVPEATDRRSLGVHRWDPSGERWQFWGDDKATKAELGTTTDRFGIFALLEDASAPVATEVVRRQVRGLPWRADAEELVVRYEEVGEGVPWDGVSFRSSAGGEDWVGVHDPDLDEATFVLPADLTGETLTGTLWLEDLAGHRTVIPVNLAP